MDRGHVTAHMSNGCGDGAAAAAAVEYSTGDIDTLKEVGTAYRTEDVWWYQSRTLGNVRVSVLVCNQTTVLFFLGWGQYTPYLLYTNTHYSTVTRNDGLSGPRCIHIVCQ